MNIKNSWSFYSDRIRFYLKSKTLFHFDCFSCRISGEYVYTSFICFYGTNFVVVFFAFLSSFICIFYSRSFCNLSNLSISGTFLCRTINNISCCTIYFLPLVYILHIFFIVLHYILQICKKLQEKKTFQRIVEKSFSHILLNHKAFNRTAGYGHYRVLYQRHF